MIKFIIPKSLGGSKKMSSSTAPELVSLKNEVEYGGFGGWVYEPYEETAGDLVPSPRNLFRPGMGIELNEENYPGMWCVGSIKRVSGDFVLAHFDGWEDYWDVWYRWDAPEMRPVGTCASLHHNLDPPYQGPDADIWRQTGDWSSYLGYKKVVPAPIEAFSPLFVSDSGEDSVILTLQALAANKVASVMHCFVFLESKIGHNLYTKLQDVRICSICQSSYVIGYRCVKAFTLQKYLKSDENRPFHTATVCSLFCLQRYKFDFIGHVSQEKMQINEAYKAATLPFCHLAVTSSRDPSDSNPSPGDQPSPENLFRVGMKVEAVDSNYPTWYCACTVLRSCGDEVLIHFDGWGSYWDMWHYWYSTMIRPIGTSKLLGVDPSIDFPAREAGFPWSTYLEETKSIAAPARAFSKLYVCEFGDEHGGISPLCILATNALLQCSYLEKRHTLKEFAQIFPFTVNDSPFRIRKCCVCSKPYFQGWMAIKPFTLTSDLSTNSYISCLCSRKCFRQFHEVHIGELV